MAFRFNPFTGNLDLVGDSGGGGTPGGSDTNIQFNDNGSFGGSSDFTWNDTTKSLSVGGNANLYGSLTAGGDVELNDGGLFTTTVQTITPTANRFISFPDATGTVALVGGASGQVIWNNAGSLAGASTLTYDGSVLTTSGRFVNSYNATVGSAPAKTFTGTWFSGGTATTTKPHVLIEPAGTISTAWSTNGTGLGVNASSGFTGNLLDLQVNGTSNFSVSSTGVLVTNTSLNYQNLSRLDNNLTLRINGILQWTAGTTTASTVDVQLHRDAAGTLAQRNGTNAQTFRLYNTITSATDHERGKLEWSSNVFRIGTEKGSGGGTARAMELQTDGVTRLALSATGTVTSNNDFVVNGGSTFTTTIQSITPTANRFITLPDRSGTVGLIAGSNGQLIYNNAGVYAGLTTLSADTSGNLTLSGRLTNTYSSVADSPAKRFSGAWFSGGTATTTKPHVLIEPAGTTSTGWSTNGTGLGINAPSGFTGNLFDAQVGGSSVFAINKPAAFTGAAFSIGGNQVFGYNSFFNGLNFASTVSLGWSSGTDFSAHDLRLFRDAANTLAQRNGTNAQAFRLYNTLTGTDVSATGNYERGFLRWNSNALEIGTEVGSGGGTLRPVLFPTNAAASTPPLSLTGTWFTGGTATTTKPQFLIEPAGTTSTAWSTNGTGLGVNAPSGFTGNLLDLQVNGASKFYVSNTGTITGSILSLPSSGFVNEIISFGNASGIQFNGRVALKSGGGVMFSVSNTACYINAQADFGFTSDSVYSGLDVVLKRDAANTLAQRNGTNAQIFRLYNTFTSATNFERLNVRWTGNEAILDCEAGSGGGTLRGLKIGSASTSLLGFYGATPVDQPAAVADLTATATTGSLPTPDGSVTIADATTPTNTELLEYCVELEAKLEAALSRLRELGLIAT